MFRLTTIAEMIFKNNTALCGVLLPCPFCGGAANTGMPVIDGGISCDRWSVACSNCDLELLSMVVSGDGWPQEAIADVVARWNTRIAPSETDTETLQDR